MLYEYINRKIEEGHQITFMPGSDMVALSSHSESEKEFIIDKLSEQMKNLIYFYKEEAFPSIRKFISLVSEETTKELNARTKTNLTVSYSYFEDVFVEHNDISLSRTSLGFTSGRVIIPTEYKYESLASGKFKEYLSTIPKSDIDVLWSRMRDIIQGEEHITSIRNNYTTKDIKIIIALAHSLPEDSIKDTLGKASAYREVVNSLKYAMDYILEQEIILEGVAIENRSLVRRRYKDNSLEVYKYNSEVFYNAGGVIEDLYGLILSNKYRSKRNIDTILEIKGELHKAYTSNIILVEERKKALSVEIYTKEYKKASVEIYNYFLENIKDNMTLDEFNRVIHIELYNTKDFDMLNIKNVIEKIHFIILGHTGLERFVKGMDHYNNILTDSNQSEVAYTVTLEMIVDLVMDNLLIT